MKRSEIRKALEAWFWCRALWGDREAKPSTVLCWDWAAYLGFHRMLLEPEYLYQPLIDYCWMTTAIKFYEGEIFFSGDTATLDMSLLRTYAVNPTTRSHAQFYAKNAGINRSHSWTFRVKESEFLSEYLKETSLKTFRVSLSIFIWKRRQLKKSLNIWKCWSPMEETAKDERSCGTGSIVFGKSTFRKIIEYRLIPMMDLIFWGEDNGVKIPLSLISSLLHEDKATTIVMKEC